MSTFLSILNNELEKQRLILHRVKRELKNAPKGFLRARKRRNTISLYHVTSSLETNVTKNPEKIKALIDQKINANIEKTTLGDLDALAAFKSKLEKGE